MTIFRTSEVKDAAREDNDRRDATNRSTLRLEDIMKG